MGMDLGSVYSSLEFRLDSFEASITKALNGFYKLQLGTAEASKLMDRSVFTAVGNIDKSYKLLEVSSQRTGLSMFNNSKYTEAIKEKMSLFEKEIGKTDKTLNQLVEKFGKNSKEVENYKSHILDLKLAHAELNQELNKQNSMSGRLEYLNSSLKATEDKFAGFTQIGQRVSGVGRSITLGLTTPIVGAGVAALKTSADFEQGMSNIKAVTGASGEEIKKLRDLSIQTGKDTAFSASEAAKGIEELAKAGLTTEQILDGGLKGALSLAAAGELELGEAAEIASTALNAFKRDGISVTQAADLLAGAANASATDVKELKFALAACASVASSVGISFKDTSTALAVFAQNGLKGSDAGTSLKTMLLNLQPKTKQQVATFKELGLVTEKGTSAFVDANGHMKSMSEIAELLKTHTEKLTDAQRQQALETMFGTDAIRAASIMSKEGAKGFSNMYSEMSKVTAAETAAEKMNNLKGSIEEFNGSVETAAIQLGTSMIPTIRSFTDHLKTLVDRFIQLSPEQQQTYVKFGLIAASVGPCILIFGKFMESIVAINKGFQLFKGLFIAKEIATVGSVATSAAGGVAALGTSTKVATLALNPWVLGIAAAGFGLYKLVNYLRSDCVPAVDVFADRFIADNRKVDESFKKLDSGAKISLDDMSNKVKASASNSGKELVKISDSTKKAISAYMDLDKKAGTALLSLKANNTKITKEIANDMSKNINDMSKQITNGLDKRKGEAEKTFQDFFKNAKNIVDTEKDSILKSIQNGYEQQKKSAEDAKNRINKIYQNAADNNREITNDELAEIQKLQEQMKQQAINTLTQSQLEQQAIYEGIKANATRITTEQASDVIKNSAHQRDQTIANANEQYKKTVAEIIYQRDVTGTISADQAQKLINEAERQRKESVGKAEEMHKQVVDEVGKQCEDVGKKIDEKSGEIKQAWQRLIEWFDQHVIHPKVEVKTDLRSNSEGDFGNNNKSKSGTQTGPGALYGEQYATGTTNAARGWNLVGEEGPELLWFEGGETVLNNRDTMSLMNNLGSKIGYSSSREWGIDITQGFADGINSNRGVVRNAALSVADSIYRVLHFSVPDEGPLSDADQYSPDFMQLLADSIDENSDKPGEAAKDVADKIKKVIDMKKSELKDSLDKLKEDAKVKVDNLNKEFRDLSDYEITATRGKKGSEKFAIQDSIRSQKEAIQDKIRAIKDGLDDEIKLRKDAAEKEIKMLQEGGKAAKDILLQEVKDRKDFVSKVNDLSKQLVESLKEKYQEEEKSQEDAINAELENLDIWKDESEQRINDVYDSKIKAIENATNAQEKALKAEMDALEESEKQQERVDQDNDELTRIKRLQDKIAFEHNEFNKAEMQKELNKLIQEREKRLQKQSIEDKKDSLQKQIEQIKDNANQQKLMLEDERKYELDRMNQLYKSQKDNLQKRLNDIKNFYGEKTKDARLQAEAEKLIMDNNQKEIVVLLHAYEKDYELAGQSLGERLVSGFKPKVDEIKNMISSLAQQLSSLKSEASSALSSARSMSSGSSVNWYATGAIFNRPSVIGVGEAGPEAVIPIEKLGGILREALSDMKSSGGAIVNHYTATINSPIAKTPSEERHAYETTMRKLAFEMR